jgi:hypothetical protein
MGGRRRGRNSKRAVTRPDEKRLAGAAAADSETREDHEQDDPYRHGPDEGDESRLRVAGQPRLMSPCDQPEDRKASGDQPRYSGVDLLAHREPKRDGQEDHEDQDRHLLAPGAITGIRWTRPSRQRYTATADPSPATGRCSV